MTPTEAAHRQDLGPMSAWCRDCGAKWPCAAEQEREARRLEALALHRRFLEGELTQAEYQRKLDDIGKEPDDLTRVTT